MKRISIAASVLISAASLVAACSPSTAPSASDDRYAIQEAVAASAPLVAPNGVNHHDGEETSYAGPGSTKPADVWSPGDDLHLGDDIPEVAEAIHAAIEKRKRSPIKDATARGTITYAVDARAWVRAGNDPHALMKATNDAFAKWTELTGWNFQLVTWGAARHPMEIRPSNWFTWGTGVDLPIITTDELPKDNPFESLYRSFPSKLTLGSGGLGYGVTIRTQRLPEQTMFNLLAHEIGHALGLNHSSDRNDLMYPMVGENRPTISANGIDDEVLHDIYVSEGFTNPLVSRHEETLADPANDGYCHVEVTIENPVWQPKACPGQAKVIVSFYHAGALLDEAWATNTGRLDAPDLREKSVIAGMTYEGLKKHIYGMPGMQAMSSPSKAAAPKGQ